MPGPENIKSPITLISHGRSGTSLVMNVLAAHPDVMPCGETASLLFGTYHSMERTKGIIRFDPDPEYNGLDKHHLRCGKAVRAAFLATFPDQDPPTARWMHKPINMPWVTRHLPGVKTDAERADWYWTALRTTFPDSTNITVLRHPYDVVLSASNWWGGAHGEIWAKLVRMARVVNHPESTIGYAVSHARMVTEPAREVEKLLAYLGLPQDPRCVQATERVYVTERGQKPVPKAEAEGVVARGFSRQKDWSMIDMTSFTDDDRAILTAMWARFGETLVF